MCFSWTSLENIDAEKVQTWFYMFVEDIFAFSKADQNCVVLKMGHLFCLNGSWKKYFNLANILPA